MTFILLMLLSTPVAAALLLHALRRRSFDGGVPFIILCVATIIWSVAYVFELTAAELGEKLFWSDMQYPCYAILPVAYLALTLQFIEKGHWLTRQRLLLLLIIPCLTVLLVYTNEFHYLIRRDIHIDNKGAFAIIGKTYGPWFWVHAVYSYSLLIMSFALLVRAARKALPFFRGQSIVLLLGLSIPLTWSMMYVAGVAPFPRYDITPSLIALSGIIIAWGLFHYRLFDIMPIVREQVIEHMSNAIIVIDLRQRLVDLNPAAERLLDCKMADLMGKSINEVLEEWPELAERWPESVDADLEITRGADEPIYQLRTSQVLDRRGGSVGHFINLRDITSQKQAEALINHMAYHDPLTGLPNRRFFQERLAQELARARRRGQRLIVMFLDVDAFKSINDSYGHEIGDQVLCEVADRLKQTLREGDMVARLGGDEFVLLQTDVVDMHDAVALARRILESFHVPFILEGPPVTLTASIGISIYPDDGLTPSRLLKLADDAMYEAKQAGKDGLFLYSQIKTPAKQL